MYDTDKKEVEFRRIEYDKQEAANRILSVGLDQMLANRILIGA